MKQHEVVIRALHKFGGFATLADLYKEVLRDEDFKYETKTPRETIRRIVQTRKEIFPLRPGLWGLVSAKQDIPRELLGKASSPEQQKQSDHALYQGMWLEIGRAREFRTYVPPQDRNRMFLSASLGSLSDEERILTFSYEQTIQRASTIDVIWFNRRNMPAAFIEVENSTDFQNSLGKFTDLQDFFASFIIVAPSDKEASFKKKIGISAYDSIRERVEFKSYETTGALHARKDEYREFLRLGRS
ncbi:MAG: hypothetical protein H6505_03735 [Calditrichaeota bacterium]|nr:hypothetical protein [Calditrichota bacterium]